MKKKCIRDALLFCIKTKMWKIMRLSAFFLIVCFSHTWAISGYSQETKLTLKMNDSKIIEVLNEIEEQSEFYFLFNQKLVDVEREVDINVEKKTIDNIMQGLFAGTNVNYLIYDRQIILTTFNKELIPEQTSIVSGKVRDSNNQPLPGVSIVLKGTTQGTITDSDGNYTLSNIPPDAVLVFSFVGMRTQEVVVGSQITINVTMDEEVIGIDEVVAIGYGTQKKVNLTGAVEQVTSKDLETKTASNLGLALQGVVPNLNVTITDGNPTKNPSFNIRGGTSFSGNIFLNGSPLILVDGVSMEFVDLSPSDIESISVIKDASAAAIYGARAAYGVILVTTKKGTKDLAPTVSYSSSYSMQSVMKDPGILSGAEWQQVIMDEKVLNGSNYSESDQKKLEALLNRANNPETAPNYYMEGNSIVWVENVNPWEIVYKDWAPLQNHNISLSGGGNRNTYYASLGYRDQNGLMDIGEDYRKTYNATLALSTDVTNWLNIDTKVLFTQLDTQIPYGGGYTQDVVLLQIMQWSWRNLMMPKYTPADSPGGGIPTNRAINGFLGDGHRRQLSQTLMTQIGANVKLTDFLSFKTDFAYRSIHGKMKQFLPSLARISQAWSPSTNIGTIAKTFSRDEYFVYNAYLDFNKSFLDKHEISGVLGFNQELYKYDSLNANSREFITNSVPVIKLTTGAQTITDNESHWAIRGAFMRFNYNYNNKYLFEMNGRYDGTSKFPTASRFKFFPSFSGAWRISEESFMESTKQILSDLKLRVSYGSLGNQDVINYAYIATNPVTLQVPYIFNGKSPIGVSAPGLVSPDLTWETATTIDFGLDATLFEKLTFSYDWYERTTRDILTAAEKLPSVLGTSVPQMNSGVMKTTGWEFSTRWRDTWNKLNYNIVFSLADYQSEIVSYLGNPQKLISSLYEGKKMGEIWGYVTEGIFQSYEEIDAAPSQTRINGGVWRPGDVRYANNNNDDVISPGLGTVEDPGDMKIIGNSTPRFQFGLNTSLAWKNFDFNMFWQGVGKRDFWTDSQYYWGYITGSDAAGTNWTYSNSWTPERTDAFFPAYKIAAYNSQVQTRYLINAAYARLKDITVGYTFPGHLTKNKVSSLRVYASGNNLAKISRVPKTLDPDILTGSTYAPVHHFTFGVQVKF